MKRIERILQHPLFLRCMEQISQAENDRIYCLHGLEHSLDVARISYIIDLENELSIPKDIVYGMALLHDIGRCREYLGGEAHDTAGAEIAEKILSECGYSDEDVAAVCHAIACHRRMEETDEGDGLGGLLYRADKLSRRCFSCAAYDDCYWADGMKNKTVTV